RGGEDGPRASRWWPAARGREALPWPTAASYDPAKRKGACIMAAERIYSCDDHLDLWVLPRDLWQERLPKALRERGPRVVEQETADFWVADGAMLGPSGPKMMGDYSAITRAGIQDDGFRASDPALRLQDMERDGIYASVIYGPSLFGLPIADQELKAACLVA